MRSDYLYSKIDNCLLCRHADIRRNEIAKFVHWLGFKKWAETIDMMFPVVFCKLAGGKYVANPMKRPGWCTNHGNK